MDKYEFDSAALKAWHGAAWFPPARLQPTVEYHVGMPTKQQLDRLDLGPCWFIVITRTLAESTGTQIRRFIDNWAAQKPKERQTLVDNILVVETDSGCDTEDLVPLVQEFLVESLSRGLYNEPEIEGTAFSGPSGAYTVSLLHSQSVQRLVLDVRFKEPA